MVSPKLEQQISESDWWSNLWRNKEIELWFFLLSQNLYSGVFNEEFKEKKNPFLCCFFNNHCFLCYCAANRHPKSPLEPPKSGVAFPLSKWQMFSSDQSVECLETWDGSAILSVQTLKSLLVAASVVEMAKHVSSSPGLAMALLRKRWLMVLLLLLLVSVVFLVRTAMDSSSCDCHHVETVSGKQFVSSSSPPPSPRVPVVVAPAPSPLIFMKSKLVLLVSHELSLSGSSLAVNFFEEKRMFCFPFVSAFHLWERLVSKWRNCWLVGFRSSRRKHDDPYFCFCHTLPMILENFHLSFELWEWMNHDPYCLTLLLMSDYSL